MRTASLFVILAMSTAACGPLRAEVQVEPGAPIPIEGDNGIGGEIPIGPVDVTANAYIDGESVNVDAVCLTGEVPTTYRLQVTGEKRAIEVVDGRDSGTGIELRLRVDAATYVSNADAPPRPNQADGAFNIQGDVTDPATGTSSTLDVTFGTINVPTCPAE